MIFRFCRAAPRNKWYLCISVATALLVSALSGCSSDESPMTLDEPTEIEALYKSKSPFVLSMYQDVVELGRNRRSQTTVDGVRTYFDSQLSIGELARIVLDKTPTTALLQVGCIDRSSATGVDQVTFDIVELTLTPNLHSRITFLPTLNGANVEFGVRELTSNMLSDYTPKVSKHPLKGDCVNQPFGDRVAALETARSLLPIPGPANSG
jgi:hypothetical protein